MLARTRGLEGKMGLRRGNCKAATVTAGGMTDGMESLRDLIGRNECDMLTVWPSEVMVHLRVPEEEYEIVGTPDVRLAAVRVGDLLAIVDYRKKTTQPAASHDEALADRTRVSVPASLICLYYRDGHAPGDFFSDVHVEGIILGDAEFVPEYSMND